MPRHSRSSRPPSGFLIQAASTTRTPAFTLPAHYRAMLSHLHRAAQEHPLPLIAYCLMPTQWQLVVGQMDPEGIKRYLGGVMCARGDIWPGAPVIHVQPLPTVEALVSAARDTERQALSKGLVRRAQDWPWNSLCERLQPTGRLDMVSAPFLGSPAWVDFVNTIRPEDRSAVSRCRI